MITVTGIYENGRIELLQKVEVASKQKVLVTFIEDLDDEQRLLSLQNTTKHFEDYVSDKREDLYQDFLKK